MKSIISNLTNDFKLNSFRSGVIILMYRILNSIYYQYNNKLGKVVLFFLSTMWELLKMIMNINCQISYKAKIGNGLRLPHIAEGVIISSKAQIGENVTIYHQVTIGVNEKLDIDEQRIIVGDNCYISTGAKIISCKIGNECVLGPNAVVHKNLPDKSKVFSTSYIKLKNI